jgi:hypothetical protein
VLSLFAMAQAALAGRFDAADGSGLEKAQLLKCAER